MLAAVQRRRTPPQLENAKLQLQYTKIVAPVSGRTGALLVHAGALVRPNDTSPLVVINQVSPAFVTFAVPARLLPQLRPEQPRGALRSRPPRPAAPTAPVDGHGHVHGQRRGPDHRHDPTEGDVPQPGSPALGRRVRRRHAAAVRRIRTRSSCRTRRCRPASRASSCTSSRRTRPSRPGRSRSPGSTATTSSSRVA